MVIFCDVKLNRYAVLEKGMDFCFTLKKGILFFGINSHP